MKTVLFPTEIFVSPTLGGKFKSDFSAHSEEGGAAVVVATLALDRLHDHGGDVVVLRVISGYCNSFELVNSKLAILCTDFSQLQYCGGNSNVKIVGYGTLAFHSLMRRSTSARHSLSSFALYA